MKISPCQFKTAFLVSERLDIDEAFDIVNLNSSLLPMGWSFRGTDICGAAGYVFIFETEKLPTQWQCNKVEQRLVELLKPIIN